MHLGMVSLTVLIEMRNTASILALISLTNKFTPVGLTAF
jgi:hypothetical protein